MVELGGAELEAKEEDGFTAFLCACSKGDVGCIKALVEAGCDTAGCDTAAIYRWMHARGQLVG